MSDNPRCGFFVGTFAAALAGTMAMAADWPFTQAVLPVEIVDTVELAGLDEPLLADEDAAFDAQGFPTRIGVNATVHITPDNHGTWEHLTGGRMLWRLRVLVPGVEHLNFGFSRFNMPPSATMIIAGLDGTDATQRFTTASATPKGTLWTRVIRADEVMLECVLDQSDRQAFGTGVELVSIGKGYRGFKSAGGQNTSGSCNIDVHCSEGLPWWCEIDSVAGYTSVHDGGTWLCSGGLINNTSQNSDYLFLTADHCNVFANNGDTMVLYWNYQNSTCRPPGSGESGGEGDGSLSQTTNGATVLVSRASCDMKLVRLTGQPPAAYGVTWAGWSRTTSPTVGAGVHHPSGAAKRISIPSSVADQGQYWRVYWAAGITEGGSSGSPLFDADHRIIGQLYGGQSSCQAQDEWDDYGSSLVDAWDLLSSYLDPAGTGQMTLDTLCTTDPTGACCVSTSCSVTTSTACGNQNGTYQGDGSTCAGDPCGESECVWDIDGSGSVQSADCMAMIAAWGTSNAAADLDGNGTVGIADLLLLLSNWDGCPMIPTGACCTGATCTETTEAGCGGTWHASTACGDVTCESCPDGEIADCYGNCCPDTWIGDGYCDDGLYEWNGVPIYLNCGEFKCDLGDCDEGNCF